MDVGLLLIFQNYQGRGDDADVMRDQMRLALLADELGYDKVWPPEHHFTDYSACPDNIEFLAWLAGATQRVKLATGAVIVPWNDPLRVVERIVHARPPLERSRRARPRPRSGARRVQELRHRDGREPRRASTRRRA